MEEPYSPLRLEDPGIYEIRVPGRLDEAFSEWFAGMRVTVDADDAGHSVTTLTGEVADEAALQGLLDALYTLGLRLLSLRRLGAGDE